MEQIEFSRDTYFKPKGGSKEVDFVVLSIASHGEVFDFIANSGAFSEPVARYYFKQALEGLDYCHSNGVAHRDMKPENLLLDENYDLKIADFGFAGPLEGRDGSGFLTTRLGTKNYMAPEIHDGKPYTGQSVDLFALGIILFIMVAQAPPFNTAETNKDPFYRAISQGKSAAFWRAHTKSKPNGANFFSEEFKNLIISMLQHDPMHRPSISELMYHPWMQQSVPSAEEIQKEFDGRNKAVVEQREIERQERRNQREGVLDDMNNASMRANDPPMKGIDVYVAEQLS